MQTLTIKVKDSQYALFLQFLRTLTYVEVLDVKEREKIQGANNLEEQAASDQLITEAPKKKYDFSDLKGRLEWKGDALAEQRRLRDEW